MIHNIKNNKPLPGVTISGAGAACSTTASNGTYSCQVTNGWSGTLVPALKGYTFTPDKLQFSKLTASKAQQNWKATALLNITGTATANGKPLAGVKITGSGAACSTTSSTGAYSCQVSSGWSGSLVPTLAGYTFTPAKLQYSKLTTSKSQQNWVGVLPPITISGSATFAGKGLAGVTVSGAGAKCTATTNTGAYSCLVPSGWSGALTASKTGYTFSPGTRMFIGLSKSATGHNWQAAARR